MYVIYRVNVRYPPGEHQQPTRQKAVICRTNSSWGTREQKRHRRSDPNRQRQQPKPSSLPSIIAVVYNRNNTFTYSSFLYSSLLYWFPLGFLPLLAGVSALCTPLSEHPRFCIVFVVYSPLPSTLANGLFDHFFFMIAIHSGELRPLTKIITEKFL